MTEIDGLDIHFIHVRSPYDDALPLIVTHGWPGSIIEQLKIIEPLTNPTAHGASAADAFHLVIPSLPGHGFSAKPTATGWDPVRIARAWVVLMKRLGYTRFVAQGGDWGAAVTQQMGIQAAPELARHPLQHARDRSRCHQRRGPAWRPAAAGSVRRGESARTSSGGASTPSTWPTRRSCPRARRRCTGWRTHPSTSRRSCSTTATAPASPAWWKRSSTGTLQSDLTRDDLLDNITLLLAHQHRGLRCSPLLGEQGGLLRRQAHHDPVRHQRLPRRALPGPAQLGRARLPPQPHPLQPARPGRPLRGVGAAASCSPPRCGPRSGRCVNGSSL